MFYKKVFKVEPYPFNLCVVITDDISEFKMLEIHPDDIEDMKEPEDLFTTTFYEGKANIVVSDKTVRGACCYIVFNPNNKYGNLTYGIIVHELVHAKNSLFKCIGYKPKLKNDEAEAYIMTFLTDTVINFIHECQEREADLFKEKGFIIAKQQYKL